MSLKEFLENLTGKKAKELQEKLKLLELDYENLEFINEKVNENLNSERKTNEELNKLINDLEYRDMLSREAIEERILAERKIFYKAEEESQIHILKEEQLKDRIRTLNKQIGLALKEIDFLNIIIKDLKEEIQKVKQENEQNKWDFMQLNEWIKKGYQEIIVDIKQVGYMDDVIFKNTERQLYSYYEQKKALEALNFKIERIERQIKELREDIQNNNYILDDGLKGVSYGEAVQGSGYKEGFEKQLCEISQRKEKELFEKITILEELQHRKRDLELNTTIIEHYIKNLSEENKNLMILKYKYKKSLQQIAMELHMGKTTAHRLRQKIIKNISCYLAEAQKGEA